MNLDTSKINTIQEAKDAKYGGRGLKGDKNKNIFDNPLLNTNSVLDVTKLRDTAALLDRVKTAKFITVKNSTLLTKLKETDKNSVAYQVVNANKDQVTVVIAKLEVFETPDDDPDKRENGKTKAEWEAKKVLLSASLAKSKEELKTKDKQFKKVSELVGKTLREWKEAERFKTGIQSLVTVIKGDSTLENLLSYVTAKNEKYWLQYLSGNEFKVFESDVSDGEYKFFRADNIVNNISHRFVEIMRKLDTDKLFASIEDTSNVYAPFVALRANTDELNTLKKIFEKWNDLTIYEWKWEENTMVNGKRKIAAYYGSSKYDKENRERITANDFFFVMSKIFPRATLDDNPLLEESGTYSLKDGQGNSVLEQNHSIRYSVSQRGDSIDNFNDFSTIKSTSRKLGKTTGVTNNGVIKFFWDIFHSGTDSDFALTKESTDGDGIFRWKTRLEHDGPFPTEKNQYFMEVKKAFAARLERLASDAGVNWDKRWDKVVMDIFLRATKSCTLQSTADAMRKHKIVSKLLKDHSTKMDQNTDPLVKDPSYVRKVASDHWVVKHDFLSLVDEFLYDATSDESTKQVMYESMIKGSSGKLIDEINNLRIKVSDDEVELESVQANIDLFSGLSLGQLKEKFKVVYDGGTNNGTSGPKYTKENLHYFETLLKLIKSKEEDQILDAEFTGYKDDLKTYVHDKLDPEDIITKPLFESRKLTFKERVEEIGFYDDKSVFLSELTKIRDSLKRIKGIRILSGFEESELVELEYYITNGKFKDAPIPTPEVKLTKQELNEALGITDSSDNLVESWKSFKASELNSKDKIKKLIDIVGNDKKAFANHIKANDSSITDSDENVVWNKFMKGEPKKIVETIISHELEKDDKLNSTLNEMKKVKNSSGKGLDMSKYGGGTIDKPNDKKKAAAKFLYEKYTNGSSKHEFVTSSAPEGPREEGQGFWDKWVKGTYYAPILVPLLLVGLAIFYFWDNIINWWDGPAKEGDDVDKKSE